MVAIAQSGRLVSTPLTQPVRLLHTVHESLSPIDTLLGTDRGLLFNSDKNLLRLGADGRPVQLAELADKDVRGLAISPENPADLIVVHSRLLTRLKNTPSGYVLESLSQLPRDTEGMMVDAQGGIWTNTAQNLAFHYDLKEKVLSAVQIPAEAKSEARGVRFARNGERSFVFCGNAAFETKEARRLVPLPSLPDDAIIASTAASHSGRWLFAVAERTVHANRKAFALFRLELSKVGAGWEEIYLPELARTGAVHSLIEDSTQNLLWLGTDSGLLRLDPRTFRSPPALAPLKLVMRGIPGNGELPYRRHRLEAVIDSPDFGRRRELAYQFRLRKSEDDDVPWSDFTPRPTFEFQNLSDGAYRLEVRAIDTHGQATPAAAVGFTVLPPIWRSLPAFGAYAVAVLVGFMMTVRLREARIRRRNLALERAVNERTAELQKANAAKDEFLASISHEIRNPLNGVVGLAASIDRTALDRSTAAKFEHLSHCATHLSSLLEDILDFAQLERGAFSLTPKPCEIRPLLQSVVAISAVQSAKAGRRVDVQVSPQVPPVLLVDAARLRQLLLNLVINALKYGDRGEVDVTVWAKPQGPDTALVTFAVSDEGPGMPPEEVAKLFQQFTRGSAAKRSRESGSGIGLSICRAIAGKMGGRLWAESEVGHGSTFSFEVALPIAPAAEPAAEPPAPLAWDVLVVDDEDYNRVALASLLESLGLRITTAADGTAALAACAEKQFDLVLLDYDMPGLTGPQVARELRDRGDRRVVILGTTAFATLEKHALCRQAGMNAVITKPITVEKIRAAFAEAFSAQQASPSVEIAEPGPRSPEVALRQLAERKRTDYETERREFLLAVERSAAGITQALAHSDAAAGTHHAHRLVGQLSYIGQPRAEALARRLEAACGTQQWTEAQQLWRDTQAELDQLRLDLGA